MDISGWVLVALAGVTAFVAIMGAGSALYASSAFGRARAEERLHEAYYVILPHWTSVYVFLFCLLLACGIGYLGYSQTKHSLERSMSNAQPDGVANASQPLRSE